MITLLNKSSLRPSAYLCVLCVEITTYAENAEIRRGPQRLPAHVHDRSLVGIFFSLTQNLVCDRRGVAFTKRDVLQ